MADNRGKKGDAMKNSVDLSGVSIQLQEVLYKTFVDMPVKELKTLDWFTWETDFFLEKKHERVA